MKRTSQLQKNPDVLSLDDKLFWANTLKINNEYEKWFENTGLQDSAQNSAHEHTPSILDKNEEKIAQVSNKILSPSEIVNKYKDNFKELSKPMRLYVLFNYYKISSHDGIFKRPSDSNVERLFGMARATIQRARQDLEKKQYIMKISDSDIDSERYYRIIKEYELEKMS